MLQQPSALFIGVLGGYTGEHFRLPLPIETSRLNFLLPLRVQNKQVDDAVASPVAYSFAYGRAPAPIGES